MGKQNKLMPNLIWQCQPLLLLLRRYQMSPKWLVLGVCVGGGGWHRKMKRIYFKRKQMMRKSNEVLISSTRRAIYDVGADIYSLTLSDFFLRFGLCSVRCASISSTPSIYWPHIRLIVSVGNQFSFWLCHFITSTHSQLRRRISCTRRHERMNVSDCFQQLEKILFESVFDAYKIHFNISLSLSLGPFESIWFVPQKQCRTREKAPQTVFVCVSVSALSCVSAYAICYVPKSFRWNHCDLMPDYGLGHRHSITRTRILVCCYWFWSDFCLISQYKSIGKWLADAWYIQRGFEGNETHNLILVSALCRRWRRQRFCFLFRVANV